MIVTSQPSEQSRALGFTLLEMLVVLALLGILISVLTGTISLGLSVRKRVTDITLDREDYSSFRRVLVLTLAHEYPEWIKNGQSRSVEFDGSPDHLAFLARALDCQGAGLAYYDLSFEQYSGRNTILLQTSFSAFNLGPSLMTKFAIGLASLQFEYFGTTSDGRAATWQNSWMMRTSPPELIAIKVSFPKGDHRSWPVLVIHPGIDADITCQIDPMTHDCEGR